MTDETKPMVNTVVDDGEPTISELSRYAGPHGAPAAVVRAEPAKEDETADVETETTQVRPKPRQGLLKVTAKQFAQARGIRWERAAGFLHWATQKYGARHQLTVPEWTKVHEAFTKTPV